MKMTVLACCMACIALTGCGERAAEKVVETASGGKVDIQKNGKDVTVKTADGEVTISASAKKPQDFPADIYCCTGPIKGTVKMPEGWMLTIESTTKVDEVITQTRKVMGEKGWKEAMFMNQPESTMVAFTKDDGKRSCTYQISGKNGRTTTVITAAGK